MTRPTVGQAQAWRPEALRRAADAWSHAADDLRARVDGAVGPMSDSRDFWTGPAADAARDGAAAASSSGAALVRALAIAAGAAREAADRIAGAQADLLLAVDAARADGFEVADDGTVSPTGDGAAVRAEAVSRRIVVSLDALDAADADAAHRIDAALTDVVATWPSMGQRGIADQIAAMTPAQRAELIDAAPAVVGNTDGVPWDMRFEANRRNIARAILAEAGSDPNAKRRIAFYQDLLGDVVDPATGALVERQILAFDPARSTLIELNGNLDTATSVAVLVPGMNTTVEGSAADTESARHFVSATHGEVAAITYLGGPFPHAGNPIASLAEAADPRFALDMAPRLASFSADVDRVVDATGRAVPVTYVGHSYGGSILGTAEALGLTADRTVYVAAAGAGVGVDDPGDWHNRNPHVLRFSMTAPGDPIQLVQGLPGGPHGADPDEMPGVIRLATGRYDDGRPMAGPRAHTDVIDCPASDSWRTILAVITGDREHIRVA